MAATQLELANQALAYIGTRRLASLPDPANANESQAILDHIDQAIREVLEANRWKRAIKRARLTACPSQIWVADERYRVGERVINNGSLYQCTQGGVSAASGGPSGTSASITDGSITWEYRGPYATANGEDGNAYALGVRVPVGAYCVNQGNLYRCTTVIPSTDTPPTGTATSTDGTTGVWTFVASVQRNRSRFAYQLPLPGDLLSLVEVENDYRTEYEQDGTMLYCDKQAPDIRYVFLNESYVTWDSYLTLAVVLRLASKVCSRLGAGDKKKQYIDNEYLMAIDTAIYKGAIEDGGPPQQDNGWVGGTI